ncbi:MAG: alkaline phosphatase family protein, partial [Myxococcales bacterium]|nr:alkaline phosphatase family protein [Myxococcales bacterium]
MRKLRAAVIVVAAGLALHAPVVAAPVEEIAPVDKAEPAEKPRPKINHVLIISEDGLRADAVATLHLKWHDLMRKRGSYSDHALTIRDASTLPAHASMLSGVEPKVHG